MKTSVKFGKVSDEREEDGYVIPGLNDISKNFIADCEAEKERLGEDFPLAAMLIDLAIDKVLTTGRIPGREMHADVLKQKPIKVTQKVFVPTKQFPKFNFVGKILGPKGNSLRRLQEETLCRIAIKGRHSMRDPAKEEELRRSGDAKHAHLNNDLYVEISAVSNPAEAYARVAYALSEIRKYLIPDKNDEVSQSQMKESMADPTSARKATMFAEKLSAKSSFNIHLDKKPTVSILQKLSSQSMVKQEPEEAADYQNLSRAFEPNPSMRNVSQRQAMQRESAARLDRIQSYNTAQKRARESSLGGQPYLILKRHR